MAERFISVLTTQPGSVPAYLYRHTTVVTTDADPDAYRGRATFILRTEADTDDRAAFLANYQAERLSSGLHGARVHDTQAQAEARLAEFAS